MTDHIAHQRRFQMTISKYLRKRHIGRPCKFLGFDNITYSGRVKTVKNGVACIAYHHPKAGLVTAYLDSPDHARVTVTIA